MTDQTGQSRWKTASLWSDTLRPQPSAAAVADPGRRRDVIVVGAGLTGLTTAVVLARRGLDVLVVERHSVGGVTTRGSTGKLSALQGDTILAVAETRSVADAATYAAASAAGVEGLRGLITELGIECDLRDVTDHTYATEPSAAQRCADVLTAAGAAGLPVRWQADLGLPFATLGAVALDHQACLDPGALCAGLAEHLGPGAVVEGRSVQGIEEDDSGVAVQLDDGTELQAGHAVVATLGPIVDPAMLATRCKPARSYGVVAPHPSPPTESFISLDEHSRSIRPAILDGSPAVVVVGEGHLVGDDGGRSSADRWEALAQFCREQLGAGDVARRWVAHDLVPSDRVPFIGRLAPGSQRRLVASGFQKWGISTAYVAADLAVGAIDGTTRPWSELFDPTRLASSFTSELASGAARTVRHFVGDRIADLTDDKDKRPRCTHLGCVLDFDDDERTWECPCHGSRFEEDGTVVSGPASTPLQLP